MNRRKEDKTFTETLGSIYIEQASTYALDILESSEILTVHSVYQSTVNLLSKDGSLLALQKKDSPLSPLSLCRNDESPITFLKSGDVINSSLLSILSPKTYSPVLHPRGSEYVPLLRNHIQKALVCSGDNIFVSLVAGREYTGKPELFHDFVTEVFSIAKHDSGNISELVRLIGIGTGLTPGGDDFLCGVLAGILLSESKDSPTFISLSKSVSDNLSRTNDISAAFLKCATKGLFSKAIINLKEASPENLREDPSLKIYKDFSAIGHSSGMDTLAGIYYGLTL